MKRRVLWAANVRTKPLDERLAAARAGGFTHMSLFPIDWRTWRNAGADARAMRTQIADAGIGILAIDPFVQWVPNFAMPDGYPSDYRGFIDFSEDAILRIADESGAEAINCVEGLGASYPEAALIDAFGAFADRAAARGLRITFEFMAISSVPALKDGWAIVSGANRANAGLCFDTWHYLRSGPDDPLLRAIPCAKIFEVQLADGLLALQAPTLTEDLLRFRRLPGDGDLDIAGVAATLKTIDAWNSVGPEVFADAMDARSALDAGRACAQSLERFL